MPRSIGIAPIALTDWPAHDADRWREALVAGGLLDDDGGALAGRSERDIMVCRYSYGVWLAFLEQRSLDRGLVSGLDHLGRAELDPFLQLLDARLAPFSILSFLVGLLAAARAMAQGGGFPVLEAAIRYYKRTAKPTRDKQSRMRTVHELQDLGFRLMNQPQRGTARMRFTNQYRDGMAIVMLAAMPLRISNFGSLQLGRSVWRAGECYWVYIEAKDTKNGRAIEFALPSALTPPIDLYLERHRPYLLARYKDGKDPGAAFWISSDGTALTPHLLGVRISERTREAFGKNVNPHLFRDIVATMIATDDPENVGMILPILGHASLRVSEKHYNQAKTADAVRHYQDVLQGLMGTTGD